MWAHEIHHEIGSTGFRLKRVLFSGVSPYQKVDIIETEGHGKMLFNDGAVMVSERDEFIYHDMMVHVPLFVHPQPERVLVIGGGDGGTVREVLRHKNIKKCVLVEIDPFVLSSCKEFIPQTAQALCDERVEVICGDGVNYVAQTKNTFDVVLVDSTDPVGPAQPLFGDEFYRNIKKIIGEKGVVISQAESPFYDLEVQKKLLSILKNHFEKVHIYNFTNMTYPGGLWSFSFASSSLCPIKNFSKNRVINSNLSFNWYNSEIHTASFSLPEFMKRELKEYLTEF